MGKVPEIQRVNFFELSPDQFERLCKELLEEEGLEDVQLQGKNCPGFDILAWDTVRSPVCSARILWGIQCRRRKSNVGPDVFTEALAEARRRHVNALLVISASGFRDRTVRDADSLPADNTNILKVELWDQQDLMRRLARHPQLLARYFSIDLGAALSRAPSIELLRELLAKACGLNVDDVRPDLLSRRDLELLEGRPEHAVHTYFSNFAQSLLVEKYMRSMLPELTETAEGSRSYDRYLTIEYHTTIGRRVTRSKCKELHRYRQLQDDVTYRAPLKEPRCFRFMFVRRRRRWEKSHVQEENEYSWLLGEDSPDLRQAGHIISVRNMFVGDVRLRCLERNTAANRLEIVMGSRSLKEKWGQEVDVSYTVRNVFPADRRAILSSLHAPANEHTFRLTVLNGFSGRPKVNVLGSRSDSLPRIVYSPYDAPTSVTVRQRGPLSKRSGTIVTWREPGD